MERRRSRLRAMPLYREADESAPIRLDGNMLDGNSRFVISNPEPGEMVRNLLRHSFA